MTNPLTILQGDWTGRLKMLPDGSVHCCVTSPPYDDLRSYGGHSWEFEPGAIELSRVLQDGGVLCWNVGAAVIPGTGSESLAPFKQAIFFVESAGLRLHDTMIWKKSNFSNPERTRYHQIFEYVFIFSKGAPKSFNPIKDKPNKRAGMIGCVGKNTYAKHDGTRGERTHTFVTQLLGMRGNVWEGNTRGQEEMCKKLSHPAMMPKWLVKDLILSWSNAGDTVLDPFAGSGTTGQVALQLGRKAILIELNPEYIELIRQRTNITPGLSLA